MMNLEKSGEQWDVNICPKAGSNALMTSNFFILYILPMIQLRKPILPCSDHLAKNSKYSLWVTIGNGTLYLMLYMVNSEENILILMLVVVDVEFSFILVLS